MANLRYMTTNQVTPDTVFTESPALVTTLPASHLADPDRALVARTTSLADQTITGGMAIVGDGGLCDNPDFETDTTGWAANGTASIARITSDSKFGGACLEITAGSANGTDRADYALPAPTLVEGAPYSVTALVKEAVGSGNTAQLLLEESGGASAAEWTASNTTITPTGDWVSYTITGTLQRADRTALTIYVGYSSGGQASSDKLLVDGVQIHVGSSNPAFYPTINAAVLWGHNLSSNAMWRLALSQDTAYGAGAGNVYLSDWQAAWPVGVLDNLPSDRRFSVLYFPDEVNVRSFYLQITDPANPDGYLQIGQLWLGEYTELTKQILSGFELGTDDGAKINTPPGGGTYGSGAYAGGANRQIKTAVYLNSKADRNAWANFMRQAGQTNQVWVDPFPDDADDQTHLEHAMLGLISAREPIRNRVNNLYRGALTVTEV